VDTDGLVAVQRIKPTTRLIVGVLGLGLVVGFVLWHGKSISPEWAAAMAQAAGPAAAVAYVLGFALIQPLGMSAHVLIIAGVVLWPPEIAFALGLAGAVGAAIVAWVIARYIAYDAVQARLPERVRRYEKRLVEGGFTAVLVVRLITFTMHPVMYLMGIARVPFWTMLAGTVVGFIPAVFLNVVVGKGLLVWLFG